MTPYHLILKKSERRSQRETTPVRLAVWCGCVYNNAPIHKSKNVQAAVLECEFQKNSLMADLDCKVRGGQSGPRHRRRRESWAPPAPKTISVFCSVKLRPHQQQCRSNSQQLRSNDRLVEATFEFVAKNGNNVNQSINQFYWRNGKKPLTSSQK